MPLFLVTRGYAGLAGGVKLLISCVVWQALCEKGLIGMENSHRRMIAELEEKHRQESEQLRREKELALAEETQATLAALDAMRKAHQAEVAREVAKFKQEFLTSMRQSQDINALHREHELVDYMYRLNKFTLQYFSLRLWKTFWVKFVLVKALQ